MLCVDVQLKGKCCLCICIYRVHIHKAFFFKKRNTNTALFYAIGFDLVVW